MIGLKRSLVSRNRMETVPKAQNQKRPQNPSSPKKDFSKSNQRVKELKQKEEHSIINEFLGHLGVKNSPELRDYLTKLILDRLQLDPNFSLYDLTAEEIQEIRREGSSRKIESTTVKNVNEAKTAESLIDKLKAEGLSNYETLQKLLQAHEAGEVNLLPKKYTDFSAFFQELSAGDYGTQDTQRIIQTINESHGDITAPNAFEQVIWAIYEDDQISDRTKEKICRKFKLRPIKNGDDLLDNLKIQRKRTEKHNSQVQATDSVISKLENNSKSLKIQLKELKKAILPESNLDKRLKLEKEYDRLETLLNEQSKELEIQKKKKAGLANSTPSQTVIVRGLKTELREGRIHIQLPKSKRSLSVPSNLGNRAITSTVNSYLINDILVPLGLEEYFFYQSDFTGDYPHPTSLDKNDLFLYRLGFVREGQILDNSDLLRLTTLLNVLMKPEEYQADKTLHKNAEIRLSNLFLLDSGKLKKEQFTHYLNKNNRNELDT